MPQFVVDKRLLHVDLNNETIRAKSGAMVAYVGNVDFKHAGMGGGGGFKAALKQTVAGESIKLMNCSGTGRVSFAEDGLYVTKVPLNQETISVESESILALTDGLKTDVKFTGMNGAVSGNGLATTIVQGSGEVAILSDGPMIALKVTPQQPLVVDPQAFVASVGNLQTNIQNNVSWKNAVGESSGETFSLSFTGDGIVYIQSAERRSIFG